MTWKVLEGDRSFAVDPGARLNSLVQLDEGSPQEVVEFLSVLITKKSSKGALLNFHRAFRHGARCINYRISVPELAA